MKTILEDFRSWAFKNDFLNKGKWVKKSLDTITKAYEAGKEDKLSKTYKSSQTYLMGFMDGKDEERSRLLEEIEKLKKEDMFGVGGEAMYNSFYNQALKDILEIINKLKR